MTEIRFANDVAGALKDAEVVVFLDGDRSDDPREIRLLIDPILEGRADFVQGSRFLTRNLGLQKPAPEMARTGAEAPSTARRRSPGSENVLAA